MTTRPQTLTAASVLLASACLAHGQATTDEEAGRFLEGVPAPAIERFDGPIDGWWQDAVFYEIFVRSFADSTEGPLAGDGIGDFQGLIEKLDYLNDGDPSTDTDLGVTGIWLMPINPSPSYHGYDVTDYYGINPEFGTIEDFKRFMAECEKRGIRVIIDLVLNHSSSEHPWFKEAQIPGSAKRDWYVWREDHPGWKGAWGQPVWYESPQGDGSHYFGLFWSGMPDLNFRSEGATQAVYAVTRYWLEEMGVHGFRLDAIRHLIERGRVQENTPETHEWLADWFRFKKLVNPEAFSVGEVWTDSNAISRYVGDQMDVAFEFPLGYTITESINEESSEAVLRSIREINSLYPTGMYASFVRNHDQERSATAVGGGMDEAKLAAMIHFAMPGVPFVYYGEEIGALGIGHPHETIRTPMPWTIAGASHGFSEAEPWLGLGDEVATRNVEMQGRDPWSILSLYKKMIRLRAEHEVLRTGPVVPLETDDPELLGLVRLKPDGTPGVVALFNLSDEPKRVPRMVQRALGREVILRSGRDVWPHGLPPRAGLYTLVVPEEAEDDTLGEGVDRPREE